MAGYKPIPSFDETALARFWAKVQKTDGTGCWLWLGKRSPSGYGYYREYRAHRVAFVALGGHIPNGLQLDHLCRSRLCVNPAHLEIVTNKENARRGESPSAINGKKTHCVNGHPLSGDNLRTQVVSKSHTMRQCKACHRIHKMKSAKSATGEQ